MNSGDEREFDKTLGMLREAHREPIPEAHFAAVRARVLAEIQAGQRLPAWRRLAWKWVACGLAAAAALTIFTMRPNSVTAVRHESLASRSIEMGRPGGLPHETAAVEAAVSGQRTTQSAAGRRVATRNVPGSQHRRRPAIVAATSYRIIGPPNPQPLVVKLITDDPNVVIYWIAEPRGDY